MNLETVKVIAFDADDTLWVNEPYFREAELVFCQHLSSYMNEQKIMDILYKIEMQNLPLYGYGIKSFMLSMIETLVLVTDGKAPLSIVDECIKIGKEQLQEPVKLLEGVTDVLSGLSKTHKLVVATKGDLLDQERKLEASGLLPYFHHIEVMSDKQTKDYQKLLNRLAIDASELLMIGNSLKSDVVPVLELGGHGIHVPFHTTWIHEVVNEPVLNDKYCELGEIKDVLSLF